MMGLVEHAAAGAGRAFLPSGLPGFLLADDAWAHVLVDPEHERLHNPYSTF